MKTSELIRKLAYEIQMYGDLELSFRLLDKNLNQRYILGYLDVSHDLDKTGLVIWQHYNDEKDLALTWEDIAKIDALILEVNNEFAVDYSKEISREQFYTEVLNRFNKSKEGK